MRVNRVVYIFAFAALLLSGCKSTKVGGTSDCPKRDVEDLEQILRAKRTIPFDFYYGKISMDVKDSKQSNSFKTTLKMKPDSAFSGTIKVAGIIGAAFLVDEDTVAFTNKLKKCFKKESYSRLAEMFGTDVNYEFMEALVLGHPVGVNTIDQLYPLKDEQYYVLSSHDRKVMDRLETSNLNDEEQQYIFVRYKLDCGNLSLAQILIDVPKDAVSIKIDFISRQKVEEIDFPKETAIKILTADDSVFINMDYGLPRLNDPKRVRLSIPTTYSECE
jgi:hypothetical protein